MLRSARQVGFARRHPGLAQRHPGLAQRHPGFAQRLPGLAQRLPGLALLVVSSLVALSLAGCASVDPRPDYEQAMREIRATTGEQAIHDPDEPVLSGAQIETLLADGLGLDEAARLALLNNRRLQAGFLDLGVARAEYEQAGLLANPSLSLAFLFPDAGGRVRWTADLVASVAELWQIRSRKALAQAGVEQRVLELSRFAGELVAATKTAYLESVAAREQRSVGRASLELARRSLEGVRRQAAEGVASKLDESLAESLALGAEFAFQRSEREDVAATRTLAALLSLETDLLPVALTDPLPAPGWPTLEREAIVEASLSVRPDLRAAARAVAAAEERAGLEHRRGFPQLSAGVSAERPEGGGSNDFFIGPAAALELPIFDQNSAQVSRAEAELAQSRKEYEALVAEAKQELRAALDRAAVAARSATFAEHDLLPQAERGASLAEMAYELGDTTVLPLLQAQQAVLEARRVRIEALLEAAVARIEVERAAGAPLRAPAEAQPQR
jgi:outer membrane protein, heavy metal efflux system